MPPSILVRAAAEGDFPAVTEIYAAAVTGGTASYEIEPPDEAEMRRRWQALRGGGFPYLVALRDDTVVGYGYFGPFRTRPAYRYLVEDTVYVAPAAQRGGVGRAVLARLVALAEAAGFRQMVAVIGDGAANPASVGLHAALGFRHVGAIEGSGFKHGRWLDTVLMQRALGPGAGAPPRS